ncbi:hypothetical protein [Pelagibacterium luteolum]|uniref:Uncharacterized protein n=1 Tax=Pelagibacterium luteolum TaxID=440168 RepID=A0A1G7XIJ0_9HYPH|nr:hypothetical protein [Pelagibacterium luteolum]SDG83881.1 hypothetical protein SAMN04487974_109133 [Pelagibacterium luteolum]
MSKRAPPPEFPFGGYAGWGTVIVVASIVGVTAALFIFKLTGAL